MRTDGTLWHSTAAASTPTAIFGQGAGLPVISYADGYNASCAVLADHNVYCWTYPEEGQQPVALGCLKSTADPPIRGRHGAGQPELPFPRRRKRERPGTQSAVVVRMGRPMACAVGLVASLSLLRAATGCSASNDSPGSPDASEDATGRASASSAPGASGFAGDAAAAGEGDPGILVGGGGSCPARADAAACPAIPSIVAPPVPPPNAPPLPIYGSWVGCQYSSCSTPSACTTCTCIAGDAGAAWGCSDAAWQVEGDAQPTPYCALNAGPVDAGDQPNVGPIEQCTEQYPTCSGPYPESPGWQCCRISTLGGVSEISCMPNDAAAYAGHFGP